MSFFSKAEPRYSVLVPIYNSEKTAAELWRRIQAALGPVEGGYEAVMVDDGSRDGVWAVLEGLAAKDKRLKIVQLSRNFGQQKAVLCGLHYCRGEFVVTLDDDLQDPPEDIPRLIEALQGDPEADVVCARSSDKRGLLRSFLGFCYHLLQNFLYRTNSRLRVSSFKIMRRVVVDEILKNGSKNVLIGDILLEITHRIRNVEIRREKRGAGRSGYTAAKLLSQSWDMVVNRSDFPLQLISALGFVCAFASVAMIAFFLTRYCLGGIGVSGWTSLILINLFFPGMILFSFGVVGQYLIRILREVNDTPQYVVRRTRGVE